MNPRTASASSEIPSTPHSRRSPAGGRLLRALVILGLVVVGLVLLVRFVGGPIVKSMVNQKLQEMPEFTGHVDTIKLALWRGGVEANGFQLHDKERPDDVPIVRFEEVDMRIAWGALFRGRLGGKMTVERAEIAIVQTELPDAQDAAEAKKKMEEIKAKIEAAGGTVELK